MGNSLYFQFGDNKDEVQMYPLEHWNIDGSATHI